MPHAARIEGSVSAEPAMTAPRPVLCRKLRRDMRASGWNARAMARSIEDSSRIGLLLLSFLPGLLWRRVRQPAR